MKNYSKIGFAAILVIVIIAVMISQKYRAGAGTSKSFTFAKYNAKEATIVIDNQTIKLSNGTAVLFPAGHEASSKDTITYFGNEAYGDINDDSKDDTAFLISRNGSGSGTFYYLVVALSSADGYGTTTHAYYLGDRIAPQNTEIKDQSVTVNYADRDFGEPMSTQPHIGRTVNVRLSVRNTLL